MDRATGEVRVRRLAGETREVVMFCAWPGWPEGLVAICHWGCAIWSCVDCNSEQGRVIRFDPNDYVGSEAASWRGAWTEERPTLAHFLADWLDDRLPFTPASSPPACPTPTAFSDAWRV